MTQKIRLAELLGALSHALDLTEGQAQGHCERSCWIGVQLGQAIGLSTEELSDLYYTLLLKDLGCSSNAARVCELYLTDDRKLKNDSKFLDGSLSQVLRFIVSNTGKDASYAERFRSVVNIMKNGGEITNQLFAARCYRGAEIARQMRFSERVADGITSLDEHWDGSGKPNALLRRDIPQESQIALLSQVADIFFIANGREAAVKEINARSGTWFDPDLVEVFNALAEIDDFWEGLATPDIASLVLAMEPIAEQRFVDEDYLDEISQAFARVIDAKSPFTAGHSDRVAIFTDLIAEELQYSKPDRRKLKRAALLHDIGKLAISNMILDKPGKLTDEEFEIIKSHPVHSAEILKGVSVFADMAEIARGHHEKLNGRGYPDGLQGDQISKETRIVTVADIFDALTADRPYRKAMTTSAALEIMQKEVGSALDENCFTALQRALNKAQEMAAA